AKFKREKAPSEFATKNKANFTPEKVKRNSQQDFELASQKVFRQSTNENRPGDSLPPGRFHFCRRLFSDDDDGEGAGLHLATALAGSRGIEFGAGEKNLVRFQVQAHGVGSLFRRDIFDDGVFVGG